MYLEVLLPSGPQLSASRLHLRCCECPSCTLLPIIQWVIIHPGEAVTAGIVAEHNSVVGFDLITNVRVRKIPGKDTHRYFFHLHALLKTREITPPFIQSLSLGIKHTYLYRCLDIAMKSQQCDWHVQKQHCLF